MTGGPLQCRWLFDLVTCLNYANSSITRMNATLKTLQNAKICSALTFSQTVYALIYLLLHLYFNKSILYAKSTLYCEWLSLYNVHNSFIVQTSLMQNKTDNLIVFIVKLFVNKLCLIRHNTPYSPGVWLPRSPVLSNIISFRWQRNGI
jgi:hypothetical protein